MSFVPGPEAEDLRGHLRRFLEHHADRPRLRAQLETDCGYDVTLWRRAVDELGLTGLATPESAGGSDADLLTLGVVFEELGRALVCAPFLSTVGLATAALRPAGGDAAASVLAAITGGAVATLAWAGPRPSATTLRWDGSAITGTAPIVLDGVDADVLLVAARDDADRVVLSRVDPLGPGVTRTALAALDTTRRLARVEFADAPGEVLVTDAVATLDRAFDTAVLLLAAEQVGGARRALDMAVEYARTRIQFGRPIGSFQAVKHRCADLLVDVELARSLVLHALHVADTDPAGLPLEAALAGSFASDAYVAVAGANIQLHGGIGFTWEHDAHLYLKRAKASQLLFGSPSAHRRAAAVRLGLTA